MFGFVLLLLGAFFLWLSIDLFFLAWWMEKHEKQLNADAFCTPRVLARTSRANFYRGLGILPEGGEGGVILCGTIGLTLVGAGFSLWLS